MKLIRFIYLTCFIFISANQVFPQTPGEWTWMRGDNFPNSAYYADMWKYDIALNEWTWMSGANTTGSVGNYTSFGIPSLVSFPACRAECTASWVDTAGMFWLFGGLSNSNSLNDIWKYNPLTNEWTWLKGGNIPNTPAIYGTQGISSPSNDPGGRYVYSRWQEQDNLWIFGGGPGVYGDLWKYNITSNEWTWVSGSNQINSLGHYDLACDVNPLDFPSARYENPTSWTDACGNFWLYGGRTAYSDLWRYSPANNVWTLINSNYLNSFPSYGTMGVSSPTNLPGRVGKFITSHPCPLTRCLRENLIC